MGGLREEDPGHLVTFAIATAAIAGIPPLAGFFSKDEILWFAFASERGGSPLLFAVAAATALMTSFYMFRLLWLTFLGKSAHGATSRASRPRVAMVDDRRAGRARGRCPRSAASSRCRTSWSRMLPLPAVDPDSHHYDTPLVVRLDRDRARGACRRGLLLRQRRRAPNGCDARLPTLHRVLSGKYYIDELYEALHRAAAAVDIRAGLPAARRPGLLDGSLHGLAASAAAPPALLARVQTGNLHLYALLVFVGLVAVLLGACVMADATMLNLVLFLPVAAWSLLISPASRDGAIRGRRSG